MTDSTSPTPLISLVQRLRGLNGLTPFYSSIVEAANRIDELERANAEQAAELERWHTQFCGALREDGLIVRKPFILTEKFDAAIARAEKAEQHLAKAQEESTKWKLLAEEGEALVKRQREERLALCEQLAEREADWNAAVEAAAKLLDNREANAKNARSQVPITIFLPSPEYDCWNRLAIAANNWAKDIRALKRPEGLDQRSAGSESNTATSAKCTDAEAVAGGAERHAGSIPAHSASLEVDYQGQDQRESAAEPLAKSTSTLADVNGMDKPGEPGLTQQSDSHPIFRDHNCANCNNGARPCRQGNPSQCEFPHAKND